MSMKTNWCYNERTDICILFILMFQSPTNIINTGFLQSKSCAKVQTKTCFLIPTTNRKLTFHTSIFFICYLCDSGVDLPQFSGGVWCSSPQWEPCRKPAAEQSWNSTDSWPSWRDSSHRRGEGRSESTSCCWSAATLHHAAPWITSVGQQNVSWFSISE